MVGDEGVGVCEEDEVADVEDCEESVDDVYAFG